MTLYIFLDNGVLNCYQYFITKTLFIGIIMLPHNYITLIDAFNHLLWLNYTCKKVIFKFPELTVRCNKLQNSVTLIE